MKADGQCCSQPMCYDPNKNEVVNPLTSSSVFPVVGTYTGGFTGFRPYSSPGQTTGSGQRSKKSVYCIITSLEIHHPDWSVSNMT